MRALALFSCLIIAGCGPTLVVDRADNGQPILIRSNQPDAKDLAEIKRKWGLGTVLNLRGADIEENPEISWHVAEKEWCQQNNITYLPMNLNDGTVPPSETDINLFLHMAKAKIFWPILIHCQAGIHRTGFFAALYRIQVNGWSAEQAIEEMESYWYNWSISDRSAIKEYLRNYTPR